MEHYAAFLRGIMPSNPNMTGAKLRGVFEGLGFTQVGSVLASGNLFFGAEASDAPALEQRIEAALGEELGIPGRTLVRTRAELRGLRDRDPFAGLVHARGTYLTATFFKDPDPRVVLPEPEDGLSRIVGYDAGARALLTITDNSIPGRTPDFMARLEKAYGTDITTRTWATVGRVLDRLEKMA